MRTLSWWFIGFIAVGFFTGVVFIKKGEEFFGFFLGLAMIGFALTNLEAFGIVNRKQALVTVTTAALTILGLAGWLLR